MRHRSARFCDCPFSIRLCLIVLVVASTLAIAQIQMRTGTVAARPATCTAGEMYFATDAIAGQNVFGCSVTNTWVLQYQIASRTIATPPATALDIAFGILIAAGIYAALVVVAALFALVLYYRLMGGR